jgi:hypothetical protein
LTDGAADREEEKRNHHAIAFPALTAELHRLVELGVAMRA